MWECRISAGCVTMYALWVIGAAGIGVGALVGINAIGQVGQALIGAGIAMVVIRDNQRTRRMLGRPGENVGPMRSVPRN